MKPLAEVERNRRAYHAKPRLNSVHRSAATFSIRDSALYRNNLTFLNHWKIKRGIPEVGARHTLRDADGETVTQIFDVVDEPRVYSYDMDDLASTAGVTPPRTGTWEVEFFSARNMFIPYPAVIGNTSSDRFFNQTHAFARVLNDAAEDTIVNSASVCEASIDVVIDDDTDTFIEIINGPHAARDEIVFELTDQHGDATVRTVGFSAAPHAQRRYLLSELFAGDIDTVRCDRTLLVKQPTMAMFFSRVCGGLVRRNDGAISANHSYYDTSGKPEYWTVDPAHEIHSAKVFPLFDDLGLTVRLYPIFAPADLDFAVALYDDDGRMIGGPKPVGAVAADNQAITTFDLGALGLAAGARSAELRVTPRGSRVPTRIALQVCYGNGRGLASSINMSLLSPYVFAPAGKPGRAWFQAAGDPNVIDRIGLYHTPPHPTDGTQTVTATLYRTGDTETRQATFDLAGKQAWADDLENLFPDYKSFLGGRNGFVYAESGDQFFRGLTLQTHAASGHTAGEHGF